MAIFTWIVFYHSLCVFWYPFASASTSISLRSSCLKIFASREVSFVQIHRSHLLLFRISPRRKLHPVYKFGNSPVSMLCKFAILQYENKFWQFLSHGEDCWALRYILHHFHCQYICWQRLSTNERARISRVIVKTKIECSARYPRRNMETLEKESVFVVPVNLSWAQRRSDLREKSTVGELTLYGFGKLATAPQYWSTSIFSNIIYRYLVVWNCMLKEINESHIVTFK